jgi:hypothetical protein
VAKKKTFLLRIQPELWEELAGWAADEFRSVNGHIEYLLRRAVQERRGTQGDPPVRDPRRDSSRLED